MVVIFCSVKAYQGHQVDGSSIRLITETLNSIHYEFIIKLHYSFREQLLTPKVKLMLSFSKNNQQLFPFKTVKKLNFSNARESI